MDILKKLLLLSVLFLPTSMILRYEEGGGFVVNFIDAFVLFTSSYGLIYLILNKKTDFKYRKQSLLLLGVMLGSLAVNISGLNLNQVMVAMLYIVRFFSYFLIYILISVQDKTFKNQIQNALLFSGFMFGIIGLIQFAFYPYLRNIEYLGWDVHLYRLVSSFLDPNFAGIYFSLNSLLIIQLLLSNDRRKNLLIFLLSLSLVCLLLTYSRTAFIAFALGASVLFILNRQIKIIGVLLTLSVLSLSILFLTGRSEGTNLLRTTSSFARSQTYQEGIKIFSDNPVLGVGFNAYRYAWEKYDFYREKKLPGVPKHGISSNDNSLLFILATTGIVGFAIFIYFWISIIREEFKSKKPLSKVLISSFFSVFIASFFVNALFFPAILFFLWVVLGLQAESFHSDDSSERAGRGIKENS